MDVDEQKQHWEGRLEGNFSFFIFEINCFRFRLQLLFFTVTSIDLHHDQVNYNQMMSKCIACLGSSA